MSSTLTVRDTLSVGGATMLASTLSVAGAAMFASTMDVSGAVSMWSTLSVAGSAVFASTLNVSGAAIMSSTLTVSSTLSVGGAAYMGSTLSVLGAVAFRSTVDVSGAMTIGSTLSVYGNVDICGNMRIAGLLSVSGGAQFSGPFVLNSTLSVYDTAYFASDVQANTIRPYFGSILTVDASRVIINGSIDISGSLNRIDQTVTTLVIEDKLMRLAYDPSGNQLKDGNQNGGNNHGAGLQVDGLPDPEVADPSGIYNKSFTWQYDNLHGAAWSNLGTNSINNSTMPHEPAWMLRGGAFQMAHFRNESGHEGEGARFTMRINANQELELWKSTTGDFGSSWIDRRIARFGYSVAI